MPGAWGGALRWVISKLKVEFQLGGVCLGRLLARMGRSVASCIAGRPKACEAQLPGFRAVPVAMLVALEGAEAPRSVNLKNAAGRFQ